MLFFFIEIFDHQLKMISECVPVKSILLSHSRILIFIDAPNITQKYVSRGPKEKYVGLQWDGDGFQDILLTKI